MNAKEITALMVEPGKHPKVTKLKDDLDSLQKAVSIGADYQGLIEFANFATESRRPVVGDRGVQHLFNRLYALYTMLTGKTPKPIQYSEIWKINSALYYKNRYTNPAHPSCA